MVESVVSLDSPLDLPAERSTSYLYGRAFFQSKTLDGYPNEDAVLDHVFGVPFGKTFGLN